MGKIFELPVVGEFADGVPSTHQFPASGTAYQSSNPKVILVLPHGLFTDRRQRQAVLTVTNRGSKPHSMSG